MVTGRRGRIAAVALAAVLAACAAPIPPMSVPPDRPSASEAEIVKQLLVQADAWDKAIWTKDRAGVEANVGRRFFHIDGDGATAGREEFIADLLDPQVTIEPYTVEGLTVRVFGDTALLSAALRITGTYAGKRFDNRYRYVDTYVKEDGRWQVVAVQLTRIPRPPQAK